MRVLSVDWDYFINATLEQRLMMFPDGGNEKLPDSISDIIWAARYAEQKELSKIGLDNSGYNKLKKIIKRYCNPDTKVFIADSHSRAYDFIKEHDTGDEIDIVNIDFHHDYYNCQSEVDKKHTTEEDVNCGNWVRLLIDNDDRISYTWVCREDSDLSERLEFSPNFCGYKMIEDLLEESEPYDLLFICRSSVWSPPHLDHYFFQFIDKDVTAIGAESTEYGYLTKDRYNEQMKRQIQDYADFIETSLKEVTHGKHH